MCVLLLLLLLELLLELHYYVRHSNCHHQWRIYAGAFPNNNALFVVGTILAFEVPPDDLASRFGVVEHCNQ